ncbi:uncharacterized protein LOC135961969 [Calliphora vicina]|uniref:uncharacterized protein LOC135961969 n=1 Tax=Calliphora vicina TaxID=7373 RepID=UPI00325A94B3
MTTKTQTSTLSLKTLRGVFEQPKMNHRRDFLRENKLNLRELQKNTTHKLTQQKQEHEKKQYKHLQKFHRTQEQTAPARRSASQSRNAEYNGSRQSRITAGADEGVGGCGGGAAAAVRGKPNYLGLRRAYSQQRQSVDNLQMGSSCCCNHQAPQTQHRETQYGERIPRSASAVSFLSKAESCDKEIQTEDIHDEDFLYEALKKCSTSEVHQLHKQKSIDQLHDRDNNLHHSHSNYSLQQNEPDLKSIHSRDRAPYVYHDHYEDNKSQHDQMQQFTSRSQNSRMLNGHNHKYEQEQENVMENGEAEDLQEHFHNLKINGHLRGEPEPQSSARSRQTMCSTSTKRSLGCREDVRLPRYLEKEKREKEVERVRELSKDPNCPLGHYALTEEERLNALNKAKQKMASLINELNHMPMTTETLRLRQRKVDIEKELTQIELDIRLYSKHKVYIAETPIQY